MAVDGLCGMQVEDSHHPGREISSLRSWPCVIIITTEKPHRALTMWQGVHFTHVIISFFHFDK